MSSTIITRDNNYILSNNEQDNGCPYVIGNDALQVFLTNPQGVYYDYQTNDLSYPHKTGEKTLIVFSTNPNHFLFNYQSAAVIIPYDMIINVIYDDRAGEELAEFIMSKKNGNDEIIIPPAPPIYPEPDPEYTPSTIMRDKRILGEQIYHEIPIITLNSFSNIIRDKRVFGEQIYHEIPIAS
jgi:hypothetical protein